MKEKTGLNLKALVISIIITCVLGVMIYLSTKEIFLENYVATIGIFSYFCFMTVMVYKLICAYNEEKNK